MSETNSQQEEPELPHGRFVVKSELWGQIVSLALTFTLMGLFVFVLSLFMG